MEFIKSPINYTGNKYRLLSQMYPYLPERSGVFVDLFCGGATVGCNINAKEVLFIDSNVRVVNLLSYLANIEFESFYNNLVDIIKKYHLSLSAEVPYSEYIAKCTPDNRNNGLKEYNMEGYYQLRADYNAILDKDCAVAQMLLYTLMVYSFNNDLRFSKKGNFNLPVGKTDLNKQNLRKIKKFSERAQQHKFKFLCGSFTDKTIRELLFKADFVYADPPYLITCAVYNESGGWDTGNEKKLLELYSELLENKKQFLFSNVLQKTDCKNNLLCDWVNTNKEQIEVIKMKYDYRSSSYNKINREANEEEVIVRSLCCGY